MKYGRASKHDRVLHGITAGLAGAVLQSVFALSTKALHLTNLGFKDYGEVLILGRDLPGLISTLGLIAHFTNAAVWGVIFSYLMKLGKQKYYLLKGIGLSLFVWLFSLGMATMYKLPVFSKIPINAAYYLLVGAIIYGITMSLVYSYFDNKVKNEDLAARRKLSIGFKLIPQPARKIKTQEKKIKLRRSIKKR